jgi:DivIVA domain-containing protein
MPLTPDEVVNKRFSATKFRQGYDEEEVDEFLDEVVAELRRLTSENEDLKSKLAACERRVGELTRSGGGSPVAEPAPAPVAEPEPVMAAPVVAAAPEPEPAPVVAPVAPMPVAAPAPVSAPVAASSGPEGAASMLALAQKLHDEHVEAGRAEGAKVVSEAKEHADRLVREAEEKQRRTLGNLEQERAVLERKVEELRAFERDYRRRLKAYLEGQLRDLDSLPSAGDGPAADAGQQPTVASGGASPLPTRSAAAHQQPDSGDSGSGSGGNAEPPRFPFGN